MNTRTLSLLAIALWGATVAILALFFVRGQTRPADDGRSAVVLSAADRNLVLSEMRVLLESVRGITEGVRRGDRRAVEDAARRAGTHAMVESNAELMMRLPLEFKQLGMSVHRGFDSIADAAREGESDAELLGLLGENLGRCVACHAAYRLEPAQ